MDVAILVENQLLKVILVEGDENGSGLMPLEKPQHQIQIQSAVYNLHGRDIPLVRVTTESCTVPACSASHVLKCIARLQCL